MKKIIFTSLIAFLSLISFGQSKNGNNKSAQPQDASEVMRLDKTGSHPKPNIKSKHLNKKSSASRANGSSNGIVIGNTYYDLQSNSSIDDRFIMNSDGSFCAAFTMSDNSGFADRGTGYLYHDGSSWTQTNPTARIEPERIGWPSVGVTKSGKEIIISHSTATNQLIMMHRAKKGTGAWTTVRDPNGAKADKVAGTGYTLWPRMAIGGKNGETIHLIALSEPIPTTGGTFTGSRYQGLDGAVCYSRSQDGGVTWDKKSVVLKGIDSSLYDGFNADSYAIYSKDDYVAIVVFHRFNHTTVLKSSDNGDTWEIMYALKLPTDNYKLGDYPILDTIYTTDNTGDVVIDNNGEVHVMFGTWAWNDADTSDRSSTGGQQYLTYQGLNGLNYWKESFGEGNHRRVVSLIDQDGDPSNFNITGGTAGLTDYGSKSLNGYPSMGVDANNAIYCTFMGIMESKSTAKPYNDGTNHYRHQFVIKSENGGCVWGSPLDLTNDGLGFEECVYGAMPPTIDDSVRVIYMEDLAAGTDVGPIDHSPGNNEMVYVALSKNNIPKNNNTCLAVIAGDKNICPGDSIWLDASPSCGSAYSWNTGASTAGIWVKTAGTYKCEITTACGKIMDSVIVAVPASGQGPKINLSSDLDDLCPSGTKTTLRVKHNSIGSSGFYIWNSGSASTVDTFNITKPGTYKVEVINCANGRSVQEITIGTVTKAVATISGNAFLCPGKSSALEVIENPGGIYTWTKSGSSTPLSNSNTLTVSSTGTYIVDVLACLGLYSAKDSFKVDVEPMPSAVIVASDSTTVCKGRKSLKLTATGQVGATFKWNDESTGSTFKVNTDSVHTFDYFAYSYNACGDSVMSNKITVKVNNIPSKPTITNNQGTFNSSNTNSYWFTKTGGSSTWKNSGHTGNPYTPTNLSVGDSVSARNKENNCFSDYSNSLVFGNVGINNQNNPYAEYGVYPNPNNGIFQVAFKGITKMNVSISIRNMVGQEILIKDLELNGSYTEEIDLSAFEAGIYMIAISNGEFKTTQKVIIR